jgi:protein O-GlcNAc transferase
MSDDALNRARQLARDGEIDGAARLLSHHLESAPDDAAAHAELALMMLDLGDAEGARRRFDKALTLEPDNAALHNDLGTALQRVNRESEAIAAYRRALELNPDLPSARYNLAKILHRRAELHEAAELLRGALEQAPGFRIARRALGLVLSDLDEDDEAGRCFESLLAEDANDLETHRDMADLHMRRCRYADAIKHLERCLALAPGDAQATLIMGACLQELGRVDEALEHYRNVLRHDRKRYYEVVKKLTGSSKGRFWVDAAELRRVLLD